MGRVDSSEADIYAMGTCVSKTQGCGGGSVSSFKKKTQKGGRYGIRRRVFSQGSLDKVDVPSMPDHSIANPTLEGSYFCFSFVDLHFCGMILVWLVLNDNRKLFDFIFL